MFRKLKDGARLWKALGQFEEIKKEIDHMDSKHLLLSKTFWGNIAGLALTLSGILPQKWAAPVMISANLILRLITDQPVHLFPQAPPKLGE